MKFNPTLRTQKFLPKRIISRNTAPQVLFLVPTCSATMGRALTRRPFVDRIPNPRVTDVTDSPALSPALWGTYPKARNSARRATTHPATLHEGLVLSFSHASRHLRRWYGQKRSGVREVTLPVEIISEIDPPRARGLLPQRIK